jgi:hypothetical protein
MDEEQGPAPAKSRQAMNPPEEDDEEEEPQTRTPIAEATGKLSKKEQYRMMMMNMGAYGGGQTEQFGAEDDDGGAPQPKPVQNKVGKMQADVVRKQGSVSHTGVLRRKKEDHGMFEDPYKAVCVASLDRGILTLKVTQNGEVRLVLWSVRVCVIHEIVSGVGLLYSGLWLLEVTQNEKSSATSGVACMHAYGYVGRDMSKAVFAP